MNSQFSNRLSTCNVIIKLYYSIAAKDICILRVPFLILSLHNLSGSFFLTRELNYDVYINSNVNLIVIRQN